MAAINESVIREFFEQNEFLVRQYKKHVAPAGRDDDEFDFLVVNPKPRPRAGDLPFLLGPGDLKFIERAIVVLKAWHTEVFSPALLTHTPDLFRFLTQRAFQQVIQSFSGERPPHKILVVPALPQEARARAESVEILRSKGLDGVLLFRTVLADLVAKVEPNRNYQKSDLLQTLRILKNYEFLKEPQLDLFRSKPRRKHPARGSSSAEPSA